MDKSSLKIIVDVDIGIKVEKYLSNNNFNIIKIREINPKMDDKEILQLAFKEKGIVLTMDKDFGELVYNSKLAHSGVLLLRLEDATGNDKVKIISHILKKYSDQLINNFCVFQNETFRIRRKINKNYY